MTMRRDLSGILDAEVETCLETGGRLRVGELARSIESGHPEMLAQLGQELAHSTLCAMIRKRCKDAVEKSVLPLFPDLGDDLPRAIAVPKRGQDEPYYVGLRHATGAELTAGLILLDRNITAAINRRDALFRVLKTFEDMGGRDDDRLIDVLAPAELVPA